MPPPVPRGTSPREVLPSGDPVFVDLVDTVAEQFGGGSLEGRLVVDCALGGGAYAEGLLKRGAKVVGVESDPSMISFARARLDQFRDNFGAIQSRCAEVGQILDIIGISGIDGMVLCIQGLPEADRRTDLIGAFVAFLRYARGPESPMVVVTASDHERYLVNQVEKEIDGIRGSRHTDLGCDVEIYTYTAEKAKA